MLVEQRLDKRALGHDFEAFRLRIVHQPLDERRRDTVAAQCLRNAGMLGDDRVNAELAIGKFSGRVLAGYAGLVAATQP